MLGDLRFMTNKTSGVVCFGGSWYGITHMRSVSFISPGINLLTALLKTFEALAITDQIEGAKFLTYLWTGLELCASRRHESDLTPKGGSDHLRNTIALVELGHDSIGEGHGVRGVDHAFRPWI